MLLLAHMLAKHNCCRKYFLTVQALQAGHGHKRKIISQEHENNVFENEGSRTLQALIQAYLGTHSH